jgi:signal transduction histidine kinase
MSHHLVVKAVEAAAPAAAAAAGVTAAERVVAAPLAWRRRLVVAGLGGCLLLAAGAPPLVTGGEAVIPVAATMIALTFVRWWPFLILGAGLLSSGAAVPGLGAAATAVAFVGVLGCAHGLGRRGAPGWAAAIAGCAIGVRLLADGPAGPYPHLLLAVGALLAVSPSVRREAEPASLSRRTIVAGVVAALLPLIGRRGFDVDVSLLMILVVAVLGVSVVIALVAGQWSLTATFIAAVIEVAVAVPLALVLNATVSGPARWAAILAGVLAGAAVAATRWRIVGAAALLVAVTIALFTLNAVTGGDLSVLPGLSPVLLIGLLAAAASAGTGSLVPALAPRGTLPLSLGVAAWAVAAVTLAVTGVNGSYLTDGDYGVEAEYMSTAAVLTLIAAAALGGFELSRQLAARRAERRHAEEIRREAAAAERERLARPIHDGVLQVLALMQRHGPSMGATGTKLAALAGEQEIALRSLLTGQVVPHAGPADLRAALHALGSPAVEVVSPAQPVPLPAGTATEITAAVRAALDNVDQHAGDGARAWILLEDETDAVRITVRDDGAGIPPGRLEKALATGRLGVAQSMRGRIADLGGTTSIGGGPSGGTEVEFWVPR